MSKGPKQFVQDDSCHWYLIPKGTKDEFLSWREAMSQDIPWSGTDFDQYHCEYPGYYTILAIEVTV